MLLLLRIIGGEEALLIQLLFSGKPRGRKNKNTIIITYKILIRLLFFPEKSNF